jgi:hypothetical protein
MERRGGLGKRKGSGADPARVVVWGKRKGACCRGEEEGSHDEREEAAANAGATRLRRRLRREQD